MWADSEADISIPQLLCQLMHRQLLLAQAVWLGRQLYVSADASAVAWAVWLRRQLMKTADYRVASWK